MKFRDASAFRTALLANLRNTNQGQDITRLVKRVVMERFLLRVGQRLGDGALLKGGYALELRLNTARATQDIDLAVEGAGVQEVFEVLQEAGAEDLGDFFSFRIARSNRRMPQGAPRGGIRLGVEPELDGRPLGAFPLDVAIGDAKPPVADLLSGVADLSFADLEPVRVLAIPIEVHLAEKLHALSLPRPRGRQNTRVKDLVDVMLLLDHGVPPIPVIRLAVDSTFERRGTHDLPTNIELPVEWATEYSYYAILLRLDSFARDFDMARARLSSLLSQLNEPSQADWWADSG